MADLPARLTQPWHEAAERVRIPPGLTLEELERRAIQETLERCDGNRTYAARALGISVRTLQRKVKAWHQRDDEPLK
jgi:DNA-binding NtrC family response regulator